MRAHTAAGWNATRRAGFFVARVARVARVAALAATAGCGPAPTPHSTVEGAPQTAPGTSSEQPVQPARVLASSASVRLLLPTDAFFREPSDGWSARFRVENRSPHTVYLDLAAPTLVHPNQYGAVTTPQRLLVDERHLLDEPLTDEELAALRATHADGDLTRLRAGEQLDVYVPFHGTGAALFAGFATQHMFVSLDGYLDMLTEDGSAERLSLAWSDTRTNDDTDVVLAMPVILGERDCRERRVVPRNGSPEWPVTTCRVR